MRPETARHRRVAVVVPGDSLVQWQAACVEQLLRLEHIDCALGMQRKRGLHRSHRPRWLHTSYISPPNLAPAQTPARLAVLGNSNHPNLIAALREYKPHVIVYLGGDEPDDALFEISPHGLWSFRVGHYSGCAVSWMEWLRRLAAGNVIPVVLEARNRCDDGGEVLQRGYFRIKPYWVSKSVDTLLATINSWPAQCCRRQEQGVRIDQSEVEADVAALKPDRPPSALWELFKGAARMVTRACKRVFEEEQWCVGVIDYPVAGFLDGKPLQEVHWLVPPGRPEFIADPFGISRGDTLYVFHERLNEDKQKGVIAWYEMSTAKQCTSPSMDVIQNNTHLSYPYLIEYEGNTYCVPESAETGEVAIYEAVEFPAAWRKAGVLLRETTIYDPTLFEFEGRWWMFGTGAEDGGLICLNIWYADDLFGAWEPHPGNPVKIDVRSSRPAGTPFFHDGYWYRPAQDCSRTYGGRVVINRIERLTQTEYQERVVATVDPWENERYSDGLHTLSAVGHQTLIDGKRLVYSFGVLWRKFRRAPLI